MLGMIFEQGGFGVEKDPALALAWYDKALDAGHQTAYGFIIKFYLSPGSGGHRSLQKALEFSEAAQVEAPDNAMVLRDAATAYAQAGDFDRAIQVLQKAMELFKDDAHKFPPTQEGMERNLEKYKRGEKPYPDWVWN